MYISIAIYMYIYGVVELWRPTLRTTGQPDSRARDRCLGHLVDCDDHVRWKATSTISKACVCIYIYIERERDTSQHTSGDFLMAHTDSTSSPPTSPKNDLRADLYHRRSGALVPGAISPCLDPNESTTFRPVAIAAASLATSAPPRIILRQG